ncbi:MAG: hypothetical protein PVF12_01370 [Thiohalocapsa sp.]
MADLVLVGILLIATGHASAQAGDERGAGHSDDAVTTSGLAPTQTEAAVLRERIATLEAELEQARLERAAAEAHVAELEAALAQHDRRRQTVAREHTAQLSAAELRAREHKDRLLSAEARIQALEAQLAERDERITGLRDAAAARESLRERLETLRARLPAPEGGSLTAEEARRRAEQDAAALARLVEDARGIDNPRLWGEVRSAENALHHSQFLVARADNARTVYRVRPGDSLRQVSLLFYGNTERWTDVFDANRHVIEDPNRLLPGLTLVVP